MNVPQLSIESHRIKRVAYPRKVGGRWSTKDNFGQTLDVGEDVSYGTIGQAFKNGQVLVEVNSKGSLSGTYWKKVDKNYHLLSKFEDVYPNFDPAREVSSAGGLGYAEKISGDDETEDQVDPETPSEEDTMQNRREEDLSEDLELIHRSYDNKKPEDLIIDRLQWKLVMRSAVRGKNTLITGPTGCGKTMTAQAVAKATNRNFYYFNLGATQDARGYLIGDKGLDEKGTTFKRSEFIQAIRDPQAVILLDELSRASMDAWNILITPLDPSQRYLRIQEENEIIDVADGAAFIGTANIGSEYTSTFQIDKALMNRFTKVEMDYLEADQIETLLNLKFDIPERDVKDIAEIADMIYDKYNDGQIESAISTRHLVEIGDMLEDRFTLREAFQAIVYPLYDDSGGSESERTAVRQVAQSKLGDETDEDLI